MADGGPERSQVLNLSGFGGWRHWVAVMPGGHTGRSYRAVVLRQSIPLKPLLLRSSRQELQENRIHLLGGLVLNHMSAEGNDQRLRLRV
jgi:hypothetical protein